MAKKQFIKQCPGCGREYNAPNQKQVCCSRKCATYPGPTPKPFWERSNIGTPKECWLWNSSTDQTGYGLLNYKGRTRRAHRIAWTLTNGPIPVGMHVLHHCDVRGCVNPSHLFLGTNADNMADMVAKGRQAHTNGERAGTSKLKESDIIEIRNLPGTALAVSKQYGVSASNIRQIRQGKAWKHVSPLPAPLTSP